MANRLESVEALPDPRVRDLFNPTRSIEGDASGA
jgi:hypothetical protein